MRAMVLKNKQLTIEEVARPKPAEGQVLARVLACGICGSDLHAARFMEDMEVAARATRRGNWYARDLSKGVVMGHEFVAEVVEVGPGVDHWKPGQRVTSMPILATPGIGAGFTSIGYSPDFPGAYSEYILMSAPFLLPVADHVSNEVAATTEPCAVGLHAVRESRIQPNEAALVMGAGPIGLMTLLWLKHEGVKYVAVSDYSAQRRELAANLGADQVFNPGEVDLVEALDAALKKPAAAGEVGYGQPGMFAAPEVVFECVGVPGTLSQAMELVQTKGRVVVVGVCMEEDRVRPMVGINKQLTLQFVLGYTGPEYAEALTAFAEGSIDTSPLVTRTVSLDDLPGQFAALADPQDCKVVYVAGR